MIVLADSLDTLATCFPDAHPPSSQAPALTEADRVLWDSLAPGLPPRVTELPPVAAPGPWSRVLVVDRAQRSQFDVLREHGAALAELPGPVACVALTGDGFHGHRSRAWATLRGNLHLSVGVVPRRSVRELVPSLVMLPAVAVVDCLEGIGHAAGAPKIKWVNDVLVEGRKVAGVLTHTSTKGDLVEDTVIGIGINVEAAPLLRPNPFVPAVGCLADFVDPPPTLAQVLEGLLGRLGARYEQLLSGGAKPCWQRYCDCSAVVGRAVRIYDERYGEWPEHGPEPEPVARGLVERIDEQLALHLRGQSEPIVRGRLAFEEPASCSGSDR